MAAENQQKEYKAWLDKPENQDFFRSFKDTILGQTIVGCNLSKTIRTAHLASCRNMRETLNVWKQQFQHYSTVFETINKYAGSRSLIDRDAMLADLVLGELLMEGDMVLGEMAYGQVWECSQTAAAEIEDDKLKIC